MTNANDEPADGHAPDEPLIRLVRPPDRAADRARVVALEAALRAVDAAVVLEDDGHDVAILVSHATRRAVRDALYGPIPAPDAREAA